LPAGRQGRRLLVLFVLTLISIGTLAGIGIGLAALQRDQRTELRDRYAARSKVFAAFVQAILAASTTASAEAQDARQYSGRINPYRFAATVRTAHESWAEVVDAESGTVLGSYGPVPSGLGKLVLAAAAGTSRIPGTAVGNLFDGALPLALAFPTSRNGIRVLVEGSPEASIGALLSSLLSRVPGSVSGSHAVIVDGNGIVLGASQGRVGVRYPNARRERADQGELNGRLYYSTPVVGSWRVIVDAPASGVYATAGTTWLPWLVLGLATASLFAAIAVAWHAIAAVEARELAHAETEQLRVDLERLNTDLERSNTDLEVLAASASHDMTSPLRRIGGFVDLIQVRLGELGVEDAKVLDYLGRIARQAQVLAGLTAVLIKYARLGGAEVTVIDLTIPARAARELHAAEIEGLGATVDIAELGYAAANAAALQEVLSNIIGNSLKYARPGEPPWIGIHAERADGKVSVRVRDHGVGIADEGREQAFAPFKRLTVEGEGYGMGLATVRRLVERMGGTVCADSPLDGPGVVIVIELSEGLVK
jgi:signal transduction histidine kinase